MKIRDNKGSITIFVLVGLLFMSAFLLISYGYNVNKSKVAQEQFNMISKIYSPKQSDEESYTDAYTDLRKKNKQTLTSSSENSNELELTKTFEGNIQSYKIYGNSVQDGTPSPTNPVEIQSVGEKTWNLSIENRTAGVLPSSSYEPTSEKAFEEDKFYRGLASSGYYKSNYDQDATFIDGVYTLYGMDYGVGLPIKVQPNTTYTVSFGEKTGEARLTYYDKDGIYLSATGALPEQKSVTTPENCYWLVICLRPSSESTYSKIMLQTGSIATGYEPYGKYKIPVKVRGKNLINISTNILSYYINASGIPTKDNVSCYTQLIPVKPNTSYTLSCETNMNTGFTTQNKRLHAYDKDGNWIQQIAYINYASGTMGYKEVTVTTPSNCAFVRVSHWLDLENYIQLEEGVATEYEPYTEPITTNIYLDEPLRKVGDYADYIDFKTGKVVRNVSSFIFGNNLSFNSTKEDRIIISNARNLRLKTSNAGMSMIWKYEYPQKNRNTAFLYTGNGYFYWYPDVTVFGVNFGDDNETIKDPKLQEWLAKQSDEIKTIYYVLATPDDSESISLPQLKTYEDYTKIEVLTEVAPSKIEATYEGYTLE